MRQRAIDETKQLIDACEQAKNRFFEMREKDAVPDFFADVMPYANDMREQLNRWQNQLVTILQQTSLRTVNPLQIELACEAMEQFFVQSFYKETSKKRFLQSIQSTTYTLQNILRQLQESE